MFQKLQLHVLGVPPPKLRCQQRSAVACPIGKRDVSEEEFGLLLVSHRDEAGFSFRRLADWVSRPLVGSRLTVGSGVTGTDGDAPRRKRHEPSEQSCALPLTLTQPCSIPGARLPIGWRFHPRPRRADAGAGA